MAKISVRNPRTGALDYHITPPTEVELLTHCNRLRKNQAAWASSSLSDRVGILLRFSNQIAENGDSLAESLCLDTGRRRMSHEAVAILRSTIKGWCDKAASILSTAAPPEKKSSIMPEVTIRTELVAYQLVGVISPWNFPLLLSLIDAIPALLAGSAAIIKPSEITPRFVEPLMRALGAVPELAGVLTFVAGGGETGKHMIDLVDMVCFTGSVKTGRSVAEHCARNFIPCFLELGGKDPVIVTKTADIDRAVTAVLRGAVSSTGQICFSIERVYVDKEIVNSFVDQLVNRAEEVELTYPDISEGDIGPLIFWKQGDIINAQLEEALAKGAKIRTGGFAETRGGGVWMRPTVVTHVTHDMQLMTEETFGPVIPVMAYSTVEEAIFLANDTKYGLSGSVIAGSASEAADIGQHINAGAISLQDTTLTSAILRDAEKMSFKLSGNGGSRMGDASMLRFIRKKVMLTNTADYVVNIKRSGESGSSK